MDQLLSLFKLMSDETRIRVMMLIYKEELCVCQITGITGIAQPKVSKALAKLRDLHLVDDTRRDKFVYYKLKDNLTILEPLFIDILNHIDQYPQLKEDQEKIITKDQYTTICNPKVML